MTWVLPPAQLLLNLMNEQFLIAGIQLMTIGFSLPPLNSI